jgi:alpha-D-xyloside xylohydrolase
MKKIRDSAMLFAALLFTLAASGDQPWPITIAASGDEIKITLDPVAPRVTASAGGEIKDLGNGVIQYHCPSGRLAIPLAEGEAIYGLTARLVTEYSGDERKTGAIGGLDRRGEKVLMWVVPTFSVYSPFYISSRGYGMFITGTFPGSYDIGANKPDEMKIEWETDPAKGLTAYFFFGSYDQILDQYTKLIGRPFLPPKWAYTPWRWRDEHRIGVPAELDGVKVNAQLAEDIKMYEQLDIPAGVYLIDRPYAEGFMGWSNLTFNPLRFPNAEKMSEIIHQRGYKLVVWGAPWAIGIGPKDFGAEARKLGYIVPGSKENIDYTNPAAVAWHQEKLTTFVKQYNIDGWKLDRGEEDIPDKVTDLWHDGRTGREMRNAYPWLYIKTYYDVMTAVKGRDFVLLPRPGYAGTQTISTNWGGDIPGTEAGLRMAIIGAQRVAFMGFPNWGTDTGGYREFTDREVFARWLAFSCLSPIMEVGGIGTHAPWNMPTKPRYDDEMITIYRRYHKLRMALLDYIYEQATKASATGAPIVRPLVFDYPDDPKVRNLGDEYLFGPDLLVAPIWQSGLREREVYLPAGAWTDFWDRAQTITGPATIKVPAPLDRIPLFIKKGSEAKFAGMEKL